MSFKKAQRILLELSGAIVGIKWEVADQMMTDTSHFFFCGLGSNNRNPLIDLSAVGRYYIATDFAGHLHSQGSLPGGSGTGYYYEFFQVNGFYAETRICVPRGLFRNALTDVDNHLYGLFHRRNSNVFVTAMEILASCKDIGAGETLE